MTTRSVRLLALDRNEAKQIFQTKEAGALATLIQGLWQDSARAADRKLDLGLDASAYVAVIQQTTALDDSAKSLLTRGGRLLPSSEESEVYLLRPDLIGPLSLAVNSIEHLAPFLAAAAARGEAIVILY